MTDLMVWRGERAWKAEARSRAIVELTAQLEQAGAARPPEVVAMLVDATLGTAMPYLEAAWRDAVLRYAWHVMAKEGDPVPLAGEPEWPPLPEYRIVRFLWRLIPAEDMPPSL